MAALIRISGPQGQATVELDPGGTLIGRDLRCEIRLDRASVSRHHARIHRDPFGSWIIEDLGSHNGVLSDGQRIEAPVFLAGRIITVDAYELRLVENTTGRPGAGGFRDTITIADERGHEELRSFQPEVSSRVGGDLLPALNSITENLLQLESPADLYALACNQLARTLEVRAIILRLTQDKTDVQGSPEVLAHHSTAPSPEGEICFSRRALTAARAQDQPVVALSQPGAGSGMQLTVSEGQAPRAVFAAQLNRRGDALDLLYIDMPQERFSDSLFAFIAAVARQISFVQMSLFLAELESKEAALRRANDELKEQDRIKDEYVFRITHDIKGHLGAIQSCLSIADADSGVGDAEQRNEFVKRASNRAVDLLAFITDLLRLTRLRLSGEIAMTRFPLEAVLIKSVATVTPQAEAKGIRLESDLAEDLGIVSGDELSIAEVVTNLLFNAIKYTPDGGAITLRARSVGERARIDVEDSGIGIPADELGRVFEEFFRASNAADFAKEGTGLGLALAKQIVDRHGGIMSAMNNPERGATFTVELRLDPLAP